MLTTTIVPQSWDADLIALRDEIFSEGGCTIRQAAEMARNSIGMLAEYAAGWDTYANEQLAIAFAPLLSEQPTDEPPPPPPVSAQRQRAINKAEWHLSSGIKLVRVAGAHLVPSGTRSSMVHRVSDDGQCSCEATGECWHREAVNLLSTTKQAA